jgi:hypothetical protein
MYLLTDRDSSIGLPPRMVVESLVKTSQAEYITYQCRPGVAPRERKSLNPICIANSAYKRWSSRFPVNGPRPTESAQALEIVMIT